MIDQRSTILMLKAAAEPTRLRILMLLRTGEHNVKDLTRILGQSQPRISRHLKLMAEAGLIERSRDGSWAYFQLAEQGPRALLLRRILEGIDPADSPLARDAKRAETVKREREATAQDYFQEHAAEWDRIRALHVAEDEVEAALLQAMGRGPFELLVDIGTGTGRMLELFAGCYQRAIGFDLNHTMLAYARSKLATAALQEASVRHGDLYDLALPDGAASAVIMHQVLHFLAEPAQAIREAARLLAPGGRLVVADFAPHAIEYFRETFAHERLGFAPAQMAEWIAAAGLDLLQTRHLSPPAGSVGDKLTVTLWTADRPRVDASIQARAETVRSSKVEA